MFQGFAEEAAAATLLFVIETDNIPAEPAAAPRLRVYSGTNGLVANGTGTAASFETAGVESATNASPIVVGSTAHGLTVGQVVLISGVTGNTAANGTFVIAAVTTDTFTLTGSTGNGAYAGGGTWKTKGLYKVTLTGGVLAALEAGKTYTVLITWAESGTGKSKEITFTVR